MLGRGSRALLIEADHPGRGLLGVGADARALADRSEYLYRLCAALDLRGVDGVIATADLVDDLILLEALNDRVIVGSTNVRVESAFASFTSGFTGFGPDAIRDVHLEAGMVRVPIYLDLQEGVGLVHSASRAIDALGAAGSVALVEPKLWRGTIAELEHDASVDGFVRAIGIVSAFGSRSSYTWLVLPVMDGLEDVLPSTTMPVLLRAAHNSPLPSESDILAMLRLPGVAGLIVPADVLYPEDGDMLATVQALAALVHADDEGAR